MKREVNKNLARLTRKKVKAAQGDHDNRLHSEPKRLHPPSVRTGVVK